MRVYLAFVIMLVAAATSAQEPAAVSPRLLDATKLPIEIEPAVLQRQYDALASMSLQTLTYSAQGPIQHIDGDTRVALPSRTKALKAGDSGIDVLQLFQGVLLATGSEELQLRENVLVDPSTRNLVFTQSIRGIPVLFGNVSLEVSDDSLWVSEVSAHFLPDRGLPMKPVLTAQDAEQVVPKALTTAGDASGYKIEIDEGTYLGYFASSIEAEPPTLVWVVRATLSLGEREEYLVDAMTGRIVHRMPLQYSLTRTVYDVNNQLVPFPNVPNQYKLTTAQIATNPSANSAYVNVAKSDAHMRLRFPSAVANLPTTMRLVVDWPFSSPNAMQEQANGADYIRFSPETQNKWSYSTPLNVVTHEFMHGFFQREITGIVLNLSDWQYGGLSEGFSDIMGYVADVVEGYDPGQFSSTWLQGHGIYKADSSRGFRSAMNPKGDPRADYNLLQIDWFDDRVRGVYNGSHYNSTILSHAYYLLVFGGMHARASDPADPAIPDINVVGQGESRARSIFMRAMQDTSLNNEPDFIKFKTAAIQAANFLYPGTGANTSARRAFEAVGVCGVSAGPPGPVSLLTMGDTQCTGIFHPIWQAVLGATRYYAEAAPASLGFSFAVPVSDVDGDTTTCLFQVNQDAVFRMQACNDCGCGPWTQTQFLNYVSPCN